MLIQSELLRLRAAVELDIQFIMDTECHPENTNFIGQWDYERHLAGLKDPNMLYMIIENTEGEQAGFIILTGLQDPNQSVCLERIAMQMKGKGYGKEAVRLVTTWVFEHTGAHRFWLDVKVFNARARHVYQSAGFITEGTLRDASKRGSVFESLVIMSQLRPEYMLRKESK
ncbi:GNAT family N-acetyltransferase [Paenibacillus terreus]|uniref:GNAT family N-acetyltransferase n=1 Tax=Paenibacillus terreus TaxID=1387834 RepID=A0ABV5BG99_9BACL